MPLQNHENSVLCIVDLQERLLPHIDNNESILKNSATLIEASGLLGIPTLLTEQYPKGLGKTDLKISTVNAEIQPIEKTSFGCLGCDEFENSLEKTNRENLILCGIETHVCVLQTALEALNKNYQVTLVADAVGSRTQQNHDLGLQRAREHGADIVSTEMVLFEWLRDAAHPNFKQISRLIK